MRFFLRVILAAAIGAGIGSAVRAFMRSGGGESAAKVAPADMPKKGKGDAVAVAPVAGADELPPHPTGWAMGRGRIVVMMSDGTCRIADRSWRDGLSDSVSQATRSHVVIDGERMLIKPRPRPAPVVSPVASGVMPVDEGAGAPVVSAAAGPVQAPASSGGLADSVAETRANMRRAFSR